MNRPSLLLAFVIALLRLPLRGSSRLSWLAAAVCLALSFATPLHAAPLSGTRSIGPTGDYASLTAAIVDVQAVGNGLNGPLVLELQAIYVSTAETYPLTIPTLNGASAVNTLTIRPASGAAGLTISSANTTAATVDLNGAQFVTFDGRPGGTGTAKELTIANTSTAGVALRFINEASNNTIQYTTLQGVNTSATSGVVVFSTTTGANGNDNNTLDHCDIRDGASTPTNGLYALGTTGTTAQNNSGNTVSNCNVFNFYTASAATLCAGVQLSGGTTDWSISGNNFYQTASRAGVSGSTYAIYVNNTSGNNFTVTGNSIGGSASSAGGTAWIATNTGNGYRFVGIQLNVGTTAPSNVQGNSIQNIVWNSASSANSVPGVWSGIYLQAGSANIGTMTGNVVGDGIGTGSITVTSSSASGTTYGIATSSFDGVAIVNSTIGSITTNGTGVGNAASLIGINTGAGTNTISGNIIGSLTTANSLNAANATTTATGQKVTGMLISSSGPSTINGNTVANLNNNTAQAFSGSGQIRGIVVIGVENTVTGNTVRNLSTTSKNPNTTSLQSVFGLSLTSSTAGQTLSQNTVHSLTNTSDAAVGIAGIYYSGPDSGTNVIASNLVHSLAASSNTAVSRLTGMHFSSGTYTARNNMVCMGLKADGTSTASASIVRGIFDDGFMSTLSFYHNSVYLGGTHGSGGASTAAFSSRGVTNTRIFRNNIFVNSRSNSGGTGKHYAMNYTGNFSAISGFPVGLTSSGNILLANGIGGVLGFYNSADRSTLPAWQTSTGQDTTSAVADPLFVNPTGTAATVDLHLQASNPAEGGGIPVAAVTDDFDGQARSTLTPVDIGADAGSFTSTGDIFAPVISYPPLTSGSTANRALTGWATITDNSGSVSGGASGPRLYYKKSTDADAFGVANDATGNGWKYVTAIGSGPYSFTVDYSLINGGSVSIGDTIQYFVVAQDAANNLSSSPAGATASASPPVQNVNGHGAVNNFTIFKPLNAINTVGTGGDYLSLSGPSGVFEAINNSVLTGNIVINVTSDVTETGSVTLNQWTESGAGGYTLTIQPDSTTMRTISGNAANGLITLNGADHVTIDGRSDDSGRYLTFRNTNTGTTASTLLFINDASSNTMRNCVVEGAGQNSSKGVIAFSTGTVTGNDDNLITDCQVRDLSTTAGVPDDLIGSFGSSDAVANSNNTISNNELFNFGYNGIAIHTIGNDSWTLTGNNIYKVNPAASIIKGIYMDGGGTNVITDNFIHDLLNNGLTSDGIYARGPSTTTIARNLITAFDASVATTFYGIRMFGSADTTNNVVNNQIILMPAAPTSSTLYGIYTSNSNAYYNSIVLGGTESGAASSWACYCRDSATFTARNNLFLNLRTGGAGSHFAVGSEGTPGNIIASHNVYAGTGAIVATDFMDYSNTFGTAVPMDFATWQSSIGDTNSQAGIAGSGNFTTAMFTNAATGDLHLVPGGNALVNALGIAIAGVTGDYDSDPRHATTPTIGSDEFVALTPYQQWAIANNVSTDPGALGGANLQAFAFGTAPGSSGALVYTGAFAGGGTITATGMPVIAFDPVNGSEFRALYVRRKDHAAAGLAYTPRFSANLTSWVDSAAPPVVLADDGVNQIIGVPFPGLISGQEARFFKVTVTLTP